MELRPVGPATLIDTAGLDDTDSPLGAERVARSRAVLARCDLALIAYAGAWSPLEQAVFDDCVRRGVPAIAVRTKADVQPNSESRIPSSESSIQVSALTGAGMEALRRAILDAAPDTYLNRPAIAADLVPPGAPVVLVVPVDKEAPAGRLILPQVQTLRDLLDGHCPALVVQDAGLADALRLLREPPALVVTDSQAFARVSAIVPPDIPLTSFSVLMARFQGDLATFVQGTEALSRLRPGDTVAIAEACSHRPEDEDIGTVKIPRLLQKKIGGELRFRFLRGHNLPDDLGDVRVLIHCGACVWNRRAMLQRLADCSARGIPVSNYGMAIAWCLGILDRALQPLHTAIR
jgi:[FeFe] hydrogenase H-cluster maturation GTPase HydF